MTIMCLPEVIVESPTNCWSMSNLDVVGISLPHLICFSIICPNWLTGYTLVPIMYFHVMPYNFDSFFCCQCEIIHVEKAGKKSYQHRISESVWPNGFRNPLEQKI
jgi:hypothetical protein